MTYLRQFLAVGALLALLALVSSPLLGEPDGKAASKASTQARPKVAPETAEAEDNSTGRFAGSGIFTYRPIKGETVFAWPLQPKLPPTPARPRDLLIVVSTSAVMAGAPRTAAGQIAEALVARAGAEDRIALWVANDPQGTRCLSQEFRVAGERADALLLKRALTQLRDTTTPLGAVDLKNALQQALRSFGGGEGRQRVLLFLGDGQSILNPLSAADRTALAKEMVQRRIAFFAVPLGLQLDPANLHGLAGATGGLVLRTEVTREKLADALDRYQEAFAGAILYESRLTLAPVQVAELYPQQLPPLRADSPTLVVGRLKKASSELAFTLHGKIAGQKIEASLEGKATVQEPDVDNFFLLSLADQWRQAPDQPALLRADRALALAYQQTKLQHQELLLSAEVAVENDQLEAAGRLFERARHLAPHDGEAAAGLRVVEKLKNGALTRAALRDQLARNRGQAETIKKIGDKARVARLDLAALARLEKDEQPPEKAAAPEREDLLQTQRARIVLEEQRLSALADDAVRQARRLLGTAPQSGLEILRAALARVNENPDLRGAAREALTARLQAALQETVTQARFVALKQEQEQHGKAAFAAEVKRSEQQQTLEQRVEAQFNVFKGQMNLARFEEAAKQAVIYGMFGIAQEARQKGAPVPVAAQAGYDITLAGYQVQKNSELKRLREERLLSTLLSVEKSFVPYSDEPGVYFPPLATWKALRDLRKEKYESSGLPDDEEGRREAAGVYKLLQQTIETKDFTAPMTLKDALGLLYEKLAARGRELPIILDTAAFREEAADAADPYDTQVSLPPVPRKMTIATALRLILAKIPTNNATYLIRRDFIEVTTNDRMVKDKVLRVYPVGDLVIPISQTAGLPLGGIGGIQGGARGIGGGIGGFGGIQGGFGGIQGGFGGGFGGIQGGFGGGFGGIQGGFGGGFGGIQGGFGGGFGGIQGGFGGIQGGFGGGFGGLQGGLGGFGGIQGGLGGFGGGFPGAGFGGGGLGGFGGGLGGFGGGLGGIGGIPGNFVGGAFQGGFNGALGALGASQATSLIQMITRVVAPGEWFLTQQPMPFAPMIFPGLGMVGMLGGQNMLGMVGAGPPPAPVAEGGPADIQQANTIEFFPPALALIVRAPSRIHTSITGGVIGGKVRRAEGAAMVERRGLDLAAGRKARPNAVGDQANVGQVAEAQPRANKQEELDPARVWQDVLSKENVEPGLVIATADFLFEAGKFAHAAEFLKANLRQGTVVRPWVFEALAVALEASGGDRDEVRRARLSAVALDPSDAQGFRQAARALAANKDWDRALAFCRQAALLEPNQPQPYEDSLELAELGGNVEAMAWAAGKLVSRDWPADNLVLHRKADLRVQGLAGALERSRRGAEALQLRDAVRTSRRRDLMISLTWDASTEPAEVELLVQEPCGSMARAEQTQTPGGGTLQSADVVAARPSVTYTAAEAFAGEYVITVRRSWGRPLGGRARLEIVQHQGTPRETRRLETVSLDKAATVKVMLSEGRRTALASVSPTTVPPRKTTAPRVDHVSAVHKLRALAHDGFSGGTAEVRGAAMTPGVTTSSPTLVQPMRSSYQTGIAGAAVNLTAQVKVGPDGAAALVMQPVFQTVTGGPSALNVPAIPGSAAP